MFVGLQNLMHCNITKPQNLGIGSGQPSRLDSCKIAVDKMNIFFKNMEKKIFVQHQMPFSHLLMAYKNYFFRVSAIIQPSGSIRDKEIIKFANKCGLIWYFQKLDILNINLFYLFCSENKITLMQPLMACVNIFIFAYPTQTIYLDDVLPVQRLHLLCLQNFGCQKFLNLKF